MLNIWIHLECSVSLPWSLSTLVRANLSIHKGDKCSADLFTPRQLMGLTFG